jgi:molecular chaperone DnaJ
MYIDILVETPMNLTKKQQDLLREFDKSGGSGAKSTSPQSEGFFAKVKELWQDLTDRVARPRSKCFSARADR